MEHGVGTEGGVEESPSPVRDDRANAPSDEPSIVASGQPLFAHLAHLQRTAGNRAVGALLRRSPAAASLSPRRSLQRKWSDAKSGSWNADKVDVAGTRRIPVEGLGLGNQAPDTPVAKKTKDKDGNPVDVVRTRESAKDRAIVIVPDAVSLSSGVVEVLLHFHGANIGSRNDEGDGTVRDVEIDQIPQQLTHSARNMVAVLPQGTHAPSFTISDASAYANRALKLAVPDLPGGRLGTAGTLTAGRIVISGHSGGGPAAVAAAKQMQPGSAIAPPSDDDWANASPLLLFDAINGVDELNTVTALVKQMLDTDLAKVTAAGSGAIALLKRRGVKFRSAWGSTGSWVGYKVHNVGGTYTHERGGVKETVTVDAATQSVKGVINQWFARPEHQAALGTDATTLLQSQYLVQEMVGAHDINVGTGAAPASHGAVPAGLTKSKGASDYSGGGHLEDALGVLSANPVPATSQTSSPASPPPPPVDDSNDDPDAGVGETEFDEEGIRLPGGTRPLNRAVSSWSAARAPRRRPQRELIQRASYPAGKERDSGYWGHIGHGLAADELGQRISTDLLSDQQFYAAAAEILNGYWIVDIVHTVQVIQANGKLDALASVCSSTGASFRVGLAVDLVRDPAHFDPTPAQNKLTDKEFADFTGQTRAGQAVVDASGNPVGSQADELRAIATDLTELIWIKDPSTSTLDLLAPDKAQLYKTTPWGQRDYPGTKEPGRYEGRARQMAVDLTAVRPERRANLGGDAVVTEPQFGQPHMKEFITHQLVSVPGLDPVFRLNADAAAAFVTMRAAAAADGISLEPAGGSMTFYRPPAVAAANAAASGNPSSTAKYSSHMLGLAVDLKMSYPGHALAETTTQPMSNVIAMRNSPAHKWMFKRGAKYGFYPYMNEPWHWEYNPPGFPAQFMGEFQDYKSSLPSGSGTVARAPAAVGRRAARPADRRLARVPAAPAKLSKDPSKLSIKPDPAATAPIEYAAIADDKTSWLPRKFSFTSSTSNLSVTWRWFDGSDTEVDSSTMVFGSDLSFSPNLIRDRIEAKGRSAIGTWTIRVEKDAFYDEVTIDVREQRPLSAMEGQTNQAWFNVRDLPGGKVLGSLSGDSIPITVDGKAKSGKDIFYHVTLKAATGVQQGTTTPFPAGTKVWITGQAITPVASWDQFRAQLASWEAANMSLSLDDRITRLRQMTHKADLPFDKVIGTAEGPKGTYLDQRPYKPGDWDLLADYQTVQMPDGRPVEVQHLLVGLDVLPRRKESASITEWQQTLDIGQNYSAATWAGDVGAGAADATLATDSEWEQRNQTASRADRVTRYYTTRLPTAELTADIDAWGIDAARKAATVPATTIEGLLTDYYGTSSTAVQDVGFVGPGGPTHTPNRKTAVELFLRNYGLSFGGAAGPLKGQKAARDRMRDQIVLFGKIWLRFRKSNTLASVTDVERATMAGFADDMVDQLLDDVEAIATQVGAKP